jgi:hypothetical protein
VPRSSPFGGEKVVDQIGHLLALARDQTGHLGDLFRREAAGPVPQGRGESDDARQRRAKLVADGGDETILRIRQLLETFSGAVPLPGAGDQVGGGRQGLGLEVAPGPVTPEVGEADGPYPFSGDHDRRGEFGSDSFGQVTGPDRLGKFRHLDPDRAACRQLDCDPGDVVIGA